MPCTAQVPSGISSIAAQGHSGAYTGPLPASWHSTLHPHLQAPTASPAPCIYVRDGSGPASWFFELGINSSRVGGALQYKYVKCHCLCASF